MCAERRARRPLAGRGGGGSAHGVPEEVLKLEEVRDQLDEVGGVRQGNPNEEPEVGNVLGA